MTCGKPLGGEDASRVVEVSVPALVEQLRGQLSAGHSVTFVVRGRSMRPMLEDKRDSVRLVPPRPDSVRPGDVVLAFVREGAYVLHRVVRRDGEELLLRGDGNVGMYEHCRAGDVIGVADCFYRRHARRPLPVSSRRWRLYSWLWTRVTPVRRWLLAFHRRLWLPLFG